MHKFTLFLLLAMGFAFTSQAQQEAVTKDGKVVLLFDNGTWKYAESSIPNAKDVTPSVKEIAPDTPVDIKDIQLEKSTVIEGPSAKLKKYFKSKNIVRADFTLSGKEGKAYLKMNWKVQTPEAFSYFGFIKKGENLTLELLGGKTIELVFTKEAEPTEYAKYGFSTYQVEVPLNPEQINLLQTGIVQKAIMNWGRRSEEYLVKNPTYFVNQLPKILK
ncbi:MAG: hypothetical protein ACEPOZ_04560 [Marinifilaceae bacterium]